MVQWLWKVDKGQITPFYRWKSWTAKRLTMQHDTAGAELDHDFSHLTSGWYYAHLITNLDHDKPSFYTKML